jgi:hypothetical protein
MSDLPPITEGIRKLDQPSSIEDRIEFNIEEVPKAGEGTITVEECLNHLGRIDVLINNAERVSASDYA